MIPTLLLLLSCFTVSPFYWKPKSCSHFWNDVVTNPMHRSQKGNKKFSNPALASTFSLQVCIPGILLLICFLNVVFPWTVLMPWLPDSRHSFTKLINWGMLLRSSVKWNCRMLLGSSVKWTFWTLPQLPHQYDHSPHQAVLVVYLLLWRHLYKLLDLMNTDWNTDCAEDYLSCCHKHDSNQIGHLTRYWFAGVESRSHADLHRRDNS